VAALTEHADRRTTRKKPPRRTKGGGFTNRALLIEARTASQMHRSASVLVEAEPVEVIQEVLDSLTADLRFAQRQVDRIPVDEFWRDTMVGRIPNEWVRYRDEIRDKLHYLAGRMIERGIAERAVNVRAAQTALMATMVKEAMVRAGLNGDQVASVGDELRALAEEAARRQEDPS
jgi:hypothetical protein